MNRGAEEGTGGAVAAASDSEKITAIIQIVKRERSRQGLNLVQERIKEEIEATVIEEKYQSDQELREISK